MSRIFLSALALSLLAGATLRPVPNNNPAVTITVDAALNRRVIDPRIYGVAFADNATIDDLHLPLNRWGGNTTSRYNWAISTANHARDFFFENIPDTNDGGANGESADLFITPTRAHGANAIMTIPVMGLLPTAAQKDCSYSIAKYAPQHCCSDHAPLPFENPDCGNGFDDRDPFPPLKHVNDPLDVATLYTSAHQGDWVQHMVAAHGSAAAGGVKYYAIDNEPDLWDSTHFDIHPDPSTYDEIWGKTQEYAALIKTKDPSSLVMGPELSGWMWYFDSAFGWANNHNDQTNHGGAYFVPWFLQQAQTYEQANGVRILDVLSLHWYPQGKKVGNGDITNSEFDPNDRADEVTTDTKLLRNQSTRSLWDANYVDQSWIHDLGYQNNKMRLIPLMREWVNTYYPGTQIGITEYNWGAENDPNGATAQAEILGIFGREGLDLATRWESPPAGSNVYNAYKMYRNYDGAHSTFGDLSVSSAEANADIDNVSSFAALRSSDGALTIMVMAKVLSGDTPITINLSNFIPSGGFAHYWRLSAANAIAQQADVAIAAGPSLTFLANPGTVNLFVIPSSIVAPTNVNALASGASVNVSWTAAPGAASYKVYRSTSVHDPFNFVGNAAGTTYPDAGLAADTTYLYRVAAVSGTAVSALSSSLDAATTTVFTNDPLAAGIVAKAAHVTELRKAVNAMRFAANIGKQAFTDPAVAAGTPIKAVHITQLRTALDQARNALGLSQIVYNDAVINAGSTPLRAAHITDLRNGVK